MQVGVSKEESHQHSGREAPEHQTISGLIGSGLAPASRQVWTSDSRPIRRLEPLPQRSSGASIALDANYTVLAKLLGLMLRNVFHESLGYRFRLQDDEPYVVSPDQLAHAD